MVYNAYDVYEFKDDEAAYEPIDAEGITLGEMSKRGLGECMLCVDGYMLTQLFAGKDQVKFIVWAEYLSQTQIPKKRSDLSQCVCVAF